MIIRIQRLLWAIALACAFTMSATAQGTDEYDVTIVFTGIMSFVPGDHSATVMIPHVKAGKYGKPEHDVPAHVAYILADGNYMPPDDPMNEDDDFDDAFNEGDRYHFIELQGDQIALDDENEVAVLNPRLTYNSAAPATGIHCPDSKTRNSLFWLGSQKRVFGTEQVADPLRFALRPKRKDVAARAQLLYGSLEAHVVKPGFVYGFRWPADGGPDKPEITRQALAQEVHWKFKAAHKPFVLNLLSFEGVSRRIAFQPDADRKIVIVIAQTTFGDTGPMAKPGESFEPLPVDLHYSLHHSSVSGNKKGVGPLPYLIDGVTCGADTFLDPPTLIKTSGPNDEQPAAATPSHHPTSDSHPSPSGLNCAPNMWP